MINLIAKKCFEFRNPANQEEKLRVTPGVFISAPDWVAKDPLYGWSVKDGDIVVSNTVQSASADIAADAKTDSKATDAKADNKDTSADTKAADTSADSKDAKTDSKATGK